MEGSRPCPLSGFTSLVSALLVCLCVAGCAKRKLALASDFESPDPAVRAAAACQAGEQGDREATQELVRRLEDEDPVVRMAAHESLRKLSGEDFGYRSWAPAEEREQAIARWQTWADGDRGERPRWAEGASEVKHAGFSEKAATKQQPPVSEPADEASDQFPSSAAHGESDRER